MTGEFIIDTMRLLLLIVISGLIYIRLAPHDLKAIHVVPPTRATPDKPIIRLGSALYVQLFNAAPREILDQLNTIALTARSKILAGSIKEGMITYVTRTTVFGFPDYTTVLVVPDGQGSRVTIFARQRFGRSDFGVNKTRIRNWLKALKALDQAG